MKLLTTIDHKDLISLTDELITLYALIKRVVSEFFQIWMAKH